MTDKLRLATVWLGGCSGCHMSFLDTDEFGETVTYVAKPTEPGGSSTTYSSITVVAEHLPSNVRILPLEGTYLAWLDLRDIEFTNPDGRLFPEFDEFLARGEQPELTSEVASRSDGITPDDVCVIRG